MSRPNCFRILSLDGRPLACEYTAGSTLRTCVLWPSGPVSDGDIRHVMAWWKCQGPVIPGFQRGREIEIKDRRAARAWLDEAIADHRRNNRS